MAKILGVGGVFFKAADPRAVTGWYARVLGFEVAADFPGAAFPPLTRGVTVWSPFDAATEYMARPNSRS